MNIARWAKVQGSLKFGLISSIGADSRSKNYYLRIKGEIEESLQLLDFKQLTIIRPSLLMGKRQEFRFAEKISGIILKPLLPLMFGLLKRYKPVYAWQVARVLLNQTLNDTTKLKIINNRELLDALHSKGKNKS